MTELSATIFMLPMMALIQRNDRYVDSPRLRTLYLALVLATCAFLAAHLFFGFRILAPIPQAAGRAVNIVSDGVLVLLALAVLVRRVRSGGIFSGAALRSQPGSDRA